MYAVTRPYRVLATIVIWGAFTIILTSFLTTFVSSESDPAEASPAAASLAPPDQGASEPNADPSTDLEGDEVVSIVLLIASATVIGTIMVWGGDLVENIRRNTSGTRPR